MELRHLRYFVAVAELGSFSRAAERLFVAQPPLSTQVRQLEEEVGVPLLVRMPRGVRPTPAGAAFLDEAKEVLRRAELAKRRARVTEQGGLVRIGFVPSAGHTVLPRVIRRLRSMHPGCDLDVLEKITAHQMQALLDGEIDVAFARLPVGAPENVIVLELSDPFCLAVPQGHPLRGKGPVDLRAAESAVFVSYTRHYGPAFFDQIIGLCTDAGFSPNVRYEASTLFGVLDLVNAGLGVALVPASAVTLAGKDVMLRVLRKPSRSGALAFVRRRDDVNPLVAAIAAATRDVFAELRKELRERVVGLR